MSQGIFTTINPAVTSGNQLATLLNNFKDAVVSGFSGTSRPSALQAGGYWIDTTNDPTSWQYKFYTGTTDITIFTLDLVAETATIGSASNLFEIAKVSNDAVGPILKLLKERIAGGGQTNTSDSLGEIQFKGTRDDSVEALQARVKGVAGENTTATNQGAYLVFEATSVGGASLVEIARMMNGKLGVGTTAPSTTLHVKGSGITNEKQTDDAVGSVKINKKSRVAGGGQVLSGDVISREEFKTVDDIASERTVAFVEVKAEENHLSTAQGTSWDLQTVSTGGNTPTSRIKVRADGIVEIPSLEIGGISPTELGYLDGVTSSVQTQLDAKIPLSQKGAASGVAPLNGSSLIDALYLPSYVDDVVEYANFAALPGTGEGGKIYIALDTGKQYRWTGSIYSEVSQSLSDALLFANAWRLGTARHLETQAATDAATTGANASLAAFTAGIVRLTNASLTSLANIPAGSDGQILVLVNRTGVDQTILDSVDALGTAANRILTGVGTSVTMANNAAFLLEYDSTSSRWQLIGGTGSGSGAGGINYITNYDALKNTNGYATYKDAAGTSPVDGTGGSPTLTFTRSLTTPLRGIASFLITKPASNVQGEGVSYDFTIDSADQGKVLQLSFDYKIASGTYADNDLSLWVLDVTNNVLIQPAPYLIKNSTITEKFGVEFQAGMSTSYRLIVHQGSTSAVAYTMQLDNISVGPQAKLYGSAITDWVPYTPTLPFTGLSNNVSEWRRVGDSVEVRGSFSATTAAGTYFTVSLPAGLSLNASKLSIPANTTSAPGTIVGEMYENTASSVYGSITIVTCPGTSTAVVYGGTRSSSAAAPLTPENLGNFFQGSTVFSYKFLVPVLGWSSSQVISSDADTRVVSLIAGTSAVATAQDVAIKFSAAFKDTHSAYNPVTGQFTAPSAGYYHVSAYVDGTNASGTLIYVSVNGNTTAGLNRPALGNSHTLNYPIYGASTVYALAGQTIDVRPNGAIGATAAGCSFTITKVNGPAQVMASETVAASYWITATFSASTTIPINFDSKEFDTHGAVTTSPTAWKFTAPVSGLFEIQGVSATNSAAIFKVYKNGTAYKPLGASPASYIPQSICTKIRLLAGEYVDVRPNSSVTVNGGLLNGADTSHINITRIGNY